MFVLCVYHFGVGFKPILKFVFFCFFGLLFQPKRQKPKKLNCNICPQWRGNLWTKYKIYLIIVTILLLIFLCVNSKLSKDLQNYTNPQHEFLHMGSTSPPPYTMCKKISDLVPGGFLKNGGEGHKRCT